MESECLSGNMEEGSSIPIIKWDKNLSNSITYRLISLANTIYKLMQKTVNHRLPLYLEKHHLITKFQSGFRQFHSTYDHLINLETEIQEAFVNQ